MGKIAQITLAFALVAASACLAHADQTTWTWNFTPAAGDQPTVAVTPVKYGKAWAYVVQIDDNPITAFTITRPLLKNYHWTDAPPGVAGGNVQPIVGDAALLTQRVAANSTFISWDDLRAMQADGWGATNHGYWHTGYGYDPPNGLLTEAELRRELYWSQQVIGLKLYDGERAPSHFVYPNGYTDFLPFLNDYGLLSAARVSGSSTRTMTSGNFNAMDMGRTYLDEGNWTGNGASNPMYGFPTGGPADNDLFIDFTHGMGDPGSANYIRWQTRLATIEGTYGAPGSDEFWSAPPEDVIAYHKSAQAAGVSVTPAGQVSLTIPDYLPGTALTIRINGISPATQMTAPAGGLLYRSGTTAWVTTPPLNAPGSPMPEPDMAIVYEGAFQSHITLPYPVYLAAIRIHSAGTIPEGYYPTITITHPDLTTETLPVQHILDQSELGNGWGKWYLFPTLPDRAPIETIAIDIAPAGTAFKVVEIYAVEDGTWHPVNERPTTNAGADQDITMPENTASLNGAVTDDGQPDPPAALLLSWSKLSGPGTVTFGNAASAQTTATFSVVGEYVLRLEATDGLLSSYDDVRVVVNPAGLTGSGVLQPLGWGNVTSYNFQRAFDAPPTWDGQQPVGGDTSISEFMSSWEGGNKISYIDLGPEWATWRIGQTWTKYIKFRAGAAHPFVQLWWDDDKDAVNDGVSETVLNFASQTHDSSGAWMIDVDAAASPVTPKGRYLMLKQPATIPASDVVEVAIIGHYYTEPAGLLGDFNGDGSVTHGDYTIWADHYGQSIAGVQAEHPGWFPAGSYMDGATTVTHGLYTTWADHFGDTAPLAVGQSNLPAVSVKTGLADEALSPAAARRAARMQHRLERAAARSRRRAEKAAAQARR